MICIKDNASKLFDCRSNPLIQNSLYLMLASACASFFGFIFWIIVAKKYDPEDVGVGTALISSMLLIVLLSRLGFDYSIIRFFPENNKNKVLSTSIIITTLSTILVGIMFIVGVDFFSPDLHILKNGINPALYLVFLVANSITSILGFAFIGIRKGKTYFIQSIITGTRIFFVTPMVFLGALGIFGSVGVSFIITAVLSSYYIKKYGINFSFCLDRPFLKDSVNFSVGNYLVNLFSVAPNQILPIIVLNTLGKEEAAYYYISFAVASLIFMIPNAVSMSLFVEGSNGSELKKTVSRSFTIILLLLIPSILFIQFNGNFLLDLMGKNYAENGFNLLKMMSYSSIFMSITYTYYSIMRIQNKVKRIVFLSGIIGILLVGFSYFFMLKMGLIGIGYGWITSYLIGSIIVGAILLTERKFNLDKCLQRLYKKVTDDILQTHI